MVKRRSIKAQVEAEIRDRILAERAVVAESFVIISDREPDRWYHFDYTLRIGVDHHGTYIMLNHHKIVRVEVLENKVRLFEKTGLTPAGNDCYTRHEIPVSDWNKLEAAAAGRYPWALRLPVVKAEEPHA